ncbi:2OG-Fe(II) oxygenase [Laspinema sp. A4]|uniref:2OG-Fe(II) oxygenase n=1 Tax=Laspinema sp. D2d TaxID=2953686 RepID=UPI0021BAF06E|nr:2OG-Fe(II) oxygenase [Laspinema sp. D2d]MCT7982100.1 2OG-Fe(II) oxygenase [Laspinema sp. D2d]
METMKLESNQVKVIVMMTGGHQYELSLTKDESLLRELFQALSNRGKNGRTDVIRIPNEEDGSCLYIPRDAIAAIATVPPIPVQSLSLQPPSPQPEPTPQLPQQLIESTVVQLDNFLNRAEYQELIQTIFPQEGTASSGIQLPTPQSFALSRELLLHRVQMMLPDVLIQLGLEGFPLTAMEAEETPNHAPEGQAISTDGNRPETALRVLNFCYFFYQTPKPFSGGEMRIYDSQMVNNQVSIAQSYKTIEPRQNSIVFFLTSNAYEVLPIHPNSPAFSDRCFRFRGWMRRSG